MGKIIHRIPVIIKDKKISKKKNEERWRREI